MDEIQQLSDSLRAVKYFQHLSSASSKVLVSSTIAMTYAGISFARFRKTRFLRWYLVAIFLLPGFWLFP